MIFFLKKGLDFRKRVSYKAFHRQGSGSRKTTGAFLRKKSEDFVIEDSKEEEEDM